MNDANLETLLRLSRTVVHDRHADARRVRLVRAARRSGTDAAARTVARLARLLAPRARRADAPCEACA